MQQQQQATAKKGLLERLQEGEVICAEGYLFELEKRGYVQAGSFVPEVVLEYPQVVKQLHIDFVRCGSDIVEAFTYYAHRERLAVVGKADRIEELNRQALRIAKEVAEATGTLMAGNICNTNVYVPNDPATAEKARAMFREQVQWAKEEGAEFIIAETIDYLGEALIAVEEVKAVGLPCVVTMGCHADLQTWDNVDIVEACVQLEKAGADVVGLNCHRGPATLLPILKRLCSVLKVPVAALPVPYRTTEEQPTMQTLTDTKCTCLPSARAFPTALDPFVCNRYEIAEFTKAAKELGIKYFGICCGNMPHLTRAMAEALGRRPEASKYSPDMSKHFILGSSDNTSTHNRSFSTKI
jgi:betaine-homocysteine S-methyltransferase